MAFDPIQEDVWRLTISSLKRQRIFPIDNPLAIKRCMDAYQKSPSQLITTDRERSFHLMVLATEAIDYRAPFIADDAQAEAIMTQAENQLAEACDLDGRNWDARRMLAALRAESNDAYIAYLLEGRNAVEEDLARTRAEAADPYEREYAGDLAARPFLRWLAAIASSALIAGKYRLALKTAEEALALSPADPAGMRHTAVFAMVQLECTADDLAAFRRAHAPAYQAPQVPTARGRRVHAPGDAQDAWTLIADIAVAYRALDLAGALRGVRRLLRAYPHGAEALFYQAEFPEGVFGRVNVEPDSDDELVLALSEATPLLQEGADAPDSAPFAWWLASNEVTSAALEHLDRAREIGARRAHGGEN